MENRIKVLIADDNKHLCEFIRKFLNTKEEIEILGIANTDQEEIEKIEELKPEIVITDLVRNGKYSGLEIIKTYSKKENAPHFLVISSDKKEYVIKDEIKIAGYIEKTFSMDYEEIFSEIKKIKENIKY